MNYYLKKLITFFVTLFVVSVLTFLAFNLLPGDPAQLILGTEATPASLAELHTRLGLDQSLPVRYAKWLGGILWGNMGESLQYSRPVRELIGSRLPVTASLAGLSLLLIFAVSIPLGVFSAQKSGTFLGRVLDTATLAGISLPSFFVGVVFIWVFGILLRWFTPGGYVDYRTDFPGFLQYLIFPACAIALPNVATAAKFLRASIAAEMDSDYVRTARSKGCKSSVILYRHVLKNAAIPAITLFGMMVAEVFSGSIIIEQVFSLPGIGRLLVSSISSRDFPLIESLVVYIAALVVAANFLADMLLQAADPRIRVRP
jgi:peptide/nickel transport system permease protein